MARFPPTATLDAATVFYDTDLQAFALIGDATRSLVDGEQFNVTADLANFTGRSPGGKPVKIVAYLFNDQDDRFGDPGEADLQRVADGEFVSVDDTDFQEGDTMTLTWNMGAQRFELSDAVDNAQGVKNGEDVGGLAAGTYGGYGTASFAKSLEWVVDLGRFVFTDSDGGGRAINDGDVIDAFISYAGDTKIGVIPVLIPGLVYQDRRDATAGAIANQAFDAQESTGMVTDINGFGEGQVITLMWVASEQRFVHFSSAN